MKDFDIIFQTVISNYDLFKNKKTNEWERITQHIPQYKQAKKRQCDADSEVWNYWRLLYQAHILRQQSGNEVELRARVKELERDTELADIEIERQCSKIFELEKQLKSLRKQSQQDIILKLHTEKDELRKQLDKWVYGIE